MFFACRGRSVIGMGVDGEASAAEQRLVVFPVRIADKHRCRRGQITAVISPWLLKSGPKLKKPDDLAHFTLIEAGDSHYTHQEWLTWRRWLDAHASPKLEAKRWLYFNYAYQMVQAALTGQVVVLARQGTHRHGWHRLALYAAE